MQKIGIFFSILLMMNTVNIQAKTEGILTTMVGPFKIRSTQDLNEKHVLVVAAMILAAKIGYDVSWQNTYIEKTTNWYQMLDCTIQKNQITSIKDSKLQSLFKSLDHDEILQMHTWINNSYNNWLTPWNWTYSLQKSLQNLQIIEILTIYADLFAKEENITGQDIIKTFRSKFSTISCYPLLFAYEIIEKHIQCIRNIQNHPFADLISKAIEPLHNIKVMLREEAEYTAEMQAKRTHDLQQEMIQAINSR